jgi:hypothetical protein
MAAPKKPAKTNQSSVKRQKQATAGLESAFNTTTAGLEEADKLYGRALKKLEEQREVINSINTTLKSSSDLSSKQKKGVEELTKKYAQFESLAAKYNKDVKDGLMSQDQANKKLNEHRVGFDRLLKSTKLTGKSAESIVSTLKSMSKEMQSAQDAFDKTHKKAQLLNTALDQVGSSGIPLMRELGDVLKNIVERNATGAKLAITALGAAAAGIAMNYFGAEPKAAIQAENDRKQLVIDGNADIAKIENKRGFIIAKKELERSKNRIETENTVNTLKNEADFASQRAAIQFSSTMQNAAAEFRAASKTAFFGKGLGSVSYSAGQLQLAGISAEQIAGSMSAASNAMGKNISSELAANMSVMEKRTGQSAENLASITEYFMRTDKVGAESAINMQEGFRAMADSANVNLGGAMEEVAQASKEALGYQIKSGPALAKQVIYAKSLGVSFNDIAKAGKSMVLNYKDSIKNEMQLSAMLGRNVNLSEARNLFAQGKTDEALKSIQAQGLDPAKMNMFQQEALSQALGGLDLNSIQKIAQNQGRTGGELKGANANKANKGYLAANTAAQSSLASEQANISANTAVIDAQLSGQITDAYLNSKEYKRYQASLITLEKQQTVINQKENLLFSTSVARIEQLAKTAQLGIERSVTENGLNLVAGVVGGVISNVVGGKIVDKIAGKAAGKIAEKTVSNATKKATTKASEKAAEKLLAKESGKVLAKAGAKTLGKSLLKKIPFLGLGAALFFAADRAMAGDYTGAGMEIASGGASMLPGIGTGASIGIDAAIAARDMGAFDSKNPTATVKKPGTVSSKSASVVGKPSLVLSDVQYQTRLQMKMVELLGTNAILLQSILEETDKDKSIKLNGVKLNSQLMLNARKQMAVSRKEAVGTNASM